MAKRKTIQQREIEAVTQKALNELGRVVAITSARNSKISKQVNPLRLRDSLNYRVKPYDTVTIAQNFYGKYNTPKGQATPQDRSNIQNTPIKNAIKQYLPDAKKVFIKDMTDLLFQPIRPK